jgi:hypothetical protein
MSLFDRDADDVRMIRLQVVKARGKLHHSAVLKPLRKAFSEGRRYQSAWISHEEQLRVRRLRQARDFGSNCTETLLCDPACTKTNA